jgi:hypothetical protein
MGENEVGKRMLKDVFYRRIKDEKSLQEDIKRYDRMDKNDENKNKMVSMVNESVDSFKKILDFAVR